LDEKFLLLIEKYILPQAVFSLNVSHKERIILTMNYTQMKKQQNGSGDVESSEHNVAYEVVFDNCLREILSLVGDSFRRFMATDMYYKLYED